MTAVRIKASGRPREFAAFVQPDGDLEIRVRFRRSDTTDQWRCDLCGPHRFATCPHEIAALNAWRARDKEHGS